MRFCKLSSNMYAVHAVHPHAAQIYALFCNINYSIRAHCTLSYMKGKEMLGVIKNDYDTFILCLKHCELGQQ